MSIQKYTIAGAMIGLAPDLPSDKLISLPGRGIRYYNNRSSGPYFDDNNVG